MIVYVVEIYGSHDTVKSKKLRLVESYILERQIISRVSNIYKKKVKQVEKFDDNYLIEYEGHAMTNREVSYLESRMGEIDSFVRNLRILRKENRKDLSKKDQKSIRSIIKQLEQGDVRENHILSYFGDILERPKIVDEYITNHHMFKMLIEEDFV
jgi:hypothetical protein